MITSGGGGPGADLGEDVIGAEARAGNEGQIVWVRLYGRDGDEARIKDWNLGRTFALGMVVTH
jgi:hypothetical protein